MPSVSCAVSAAVAAHFKPDTWQELAQNLKTSVGRTVVNYNDFDVGISLVKAGLDGVPNPFFAIIAGNDDRDEGLVRSENHCNPHSSISRANLAHFWVFSIVI